MSNRPPQLPSPLMFLCIGVLFILALALLAGAN